MYIQGDLYLVTPPCETTDEDGFCDLDYDDAHRHVVSDARRGGEKRRFPAAFLPHSCDEWVIGGPDELRALIEDAQAVLARMEAGS
jgi:hypothetical protein